MSGEVFFGDRILRISDIVALSERRTSAALSLSSSFQQRIQRGADFLDRLLMEEGVIYGVTTGYGDSCTVSVPQTLVNELPVHLTRFHGCGLGASLSPELTRAVIAVRLASLCRGYSGVSPALLEFLVRLLQHDILPLIPEEGSVGASGDLTPLSYLAAVVIGERRVLFRGETRDAADVLAEVGIAPHKLRPKEGLALMNGTAVMTALACIAHGRAAYVGRLAARLTSLSTLAIQGNAFHFSRELFAVKPHPGQVEVAGWIRSDLEHEEMPRNSARLQDRYSLRCAPHVVGVLVDALSFTETLLETELNSANDNPIIDGEEELILHGGHFYGGHVAFAMDSLKSCVANVADLLDRQLALLVDTRYNNGLPPNLSGAKGDRAMINHGFKAVQIAVSAWTAEALKLTMPASVFSRSTECHNQDKVSMGTIAARDCLRILELTEQVIAANLLATVQALQLRLQSGELQASHLLPQILAMKASVEDVCPLVIEDRPLDSAMRGIIGLIRARQWSLYEQG